MKRVTASLPRRCVLLGRPDHRQSAQVAIAGLLELQRGMGAREFALQEVTSSCQVIGIRWTFCSIQS